MERDWRRGKVMACLGNMRLHYGDLGDLCKLGRRCEFGSIRRGEMNHDEDQQL